ncbi:MAG: aspartate ammonia-lyase [Candidatus Omnitrophica bacterium]|nr:aspartate ammonia-lyase [Candidatus Omnitrophota bacterium]
MENTRRESDLLGERDVPEDVYWGIHTLRAQEHGQVSGLRLPPVFWQSYAVVKKAACRANLTLGYLPPEKAQAICAACDEIIAGRHAEQFVIDALSGGAGTSLNMNVNEVVANRALELLGRRRGDYQALHPLADVNLHQSTNDTFPTAVKIAALSEIDTLSGAIARLQGSFQKKEKEFARIIKLGRTELQDAVPMSLGQEFSAFAGALERDRWRTSKCTERLRVVNFGGTALGNGLAAPRDYIFLVTDILRQLTGRGISRAENLVDGTANADAFVEVSGILKAHAGNLIKIANDLRLLNYWEEIRLPPLQAGSSIMPGKVNPVLCETVIQAGLKMCANDALLAQAAARGTLQLSEFLPVVAYSLLESLAVLTRADGLFAPHIDGVVADVAVCRRRLAKSPVLITAFVPILGYERATAIVKEYAVSPDHDWWKFLEQRLGEGVVRQVLSPERLLQLGFVPDAPRPAAPEEVPDERADRDRQRPLA